MKTIKILVAVLGLFLTANVNVVFAQDIEINTNDSIYGLEASYIEDGKYISLSFYSTYDMNEITRMDAFFFQAYPSDDWSLTFPNSRGGTIHRCNEGIFDNSQKDILGEVNVEQIEKNVYKISNKIPMENPQMVVLFSMEAFKCQVYLEGEYHSDNSENIGTRSSSIWRSNTLIFFLTH